MVDVTSAGDVGSGQGGAPAAVSRAGMDYTPPTRTGAFKAAGRHTAHVRFLRRIIIIGSVLGVYVFGILVAFDPFKHLPKGVSISGVGVKGTKITMDSPKLSGVQQGGGPYSIEARSGLQDITTPSVIELLGVDAHVGMADKTMTHILADHGVYDSKEDKMSLDGDVKIANTSGYTFTLKAAEMDFKEGLFTSEQRTRVDLKGGDVLADAITIGNNGHTIAFRGHVESTFDAPEQAPDPVPPATAEAAR